MSANRSLHPITLKEILQSLDCQIVCVIGLNLPRGETQLVTYGENRAYNEMAQMLGDYLQKRVEDVEEYLPPTKKRKRP